MGAVVVQVDEAEEGRIFERNSLLRCDLAQRGINVRQMICGDVANEGAIDFVIAHTAMQPAQEYDELHGGREERGQNGIPVGKHENPAMSRLTDKESRANRLR